MGLLYLYLLPLEELKKFRNGQLPKTIPELYCSRTKWIDEIF